LRGTACVSSFEKLIKIITALEDKYGIKKIKNRLYDESAPY
jgi:hypothetical protein